jgi:hypothetical protein
MGDMQLDLLSLFSYQTSLCDRERLDFLFRQIGPHAVEGSVFLISDLPQPFQLGKGLRCRPMGA